LEKKGVERALESYIKLKTLFASRVLKKNDEKGKKIIDK